MISEEMLKNLILGHITKELKDEIAIGRQVKLAKTIMQALRIHDIVWQIEQFNCLGGNYSKGIKPCSEWCGEDMCQKPSN